MGATTLFIIAASCKNRFDLSSTALLEFLVTVRNQEIKIREEKLHSNKLKLVTKYSFL